jgi:hypothetical protein
MLDEKQQMVTDEIMAGPALCALRAGLSAARVPKAMHLTSDWKNHLIPEIDGMHVLGSNCRSLLGQRSNVYQHGLPVDP